MSIYDDLKEWGECIYVAEAYRDYEILSHAEAWDKFIEKNEHAHLIQLAIMAPCVPRVQVDIFIDNVIARAIWHALENITDTKIIAWAHAWFSNADRTPDTTCRMREYVRNIAYTQHSSTSILRMLWATRIACESVHRDGSLSYIVENALAAAPSIDDELRTLAEYWRTKPNPFK